MELDFTPRIRHLQIVTKGYVSSAMVGNYRSVFKGRGLEFDGYRAYSQGVDDAEKIDWKASQRANQLLVREFVEERNVEVFFLQDVCSSMLFGSLEKLKHEYAAEFTASLAYTILAAGDSAGLGLYSDSIVSKTPPAVGGGQYYLILKALSNPAHYGGGKNFADALKFLNSFLKTPGALVFVVSDFIGMSGSWVNYLRLAARKFDVIGVMVLDPRDRELPSAAGRIFVEDALSGRQMLVDARAVADDYARAAKAREAAVRETFLQSGCDFVTLYTDRSFVAPVMRLFEMRRKRWR